MRPFGVSLLLLRGFDDNGPQLYQIDPSGSYFAWKASAIGKNMTNAKTFLEKRYRWVGGAATPLHLLHLYPHGSSKQHQCLYFNFFVFFVKKNRAALFRRSEDMELEDAIHTALLTLKEGFEGQISGNNIEVAIVGDDHKFRVLTPAEVSDYLEEVE